jgi:hypothetical protein
MRKTCRQYHGAIDGEVYFDKAVWYKLNKITRPPRVRSAVPRLYSVFRPQQQRSAADSVRLPRG